MRQVSQVGGEGEVGRRQASLPQKAMKSMRQRSTNIGLCSTAAGRGMMGGKTWRRGWYSQTLGL